MDGSEQEMALRLMASSMLQCRARILHHEDRFPESVQRHARGHVWRAAEMMEQHDIDVSLEASTAVLKSMVNMFQALVDHVEDLKQERRRDKEDLHDAIMAMKKWRAREEMQREKQRQMELALDEEVTAHSHLEAENTQLKRQLEFAKAETEHLIKAATCTRLKNSRCSSITTYEDLLDRTRLDAMSCGTRSVLFDDSESVYNESTTMPRLANKEDDSVQHDHMRKQRAFSATSAGYLEEEKETDSMLDAAVETRMNRIRTALSRRGSV